VYWGEQETSGAVATAWNRAKGGVLASSSYPGPELLSTAGNGVMDKDNYVNQNATLTNPTIDDLRIARVADNPLARQAILDIGKRYLFRGEAKSDGNAQPRLWDGITTIFLGTTSTDSQPYDAEQVAGATSARYQSLTTTGTEYTEWSKSSVRLANLLNCDHTGVEVGVPGNGRGIRYAARYAATRYSQIDAATLELIFDPATFSISGWARVEQASDWTDTNVRACLNIGVDANNNIQVGSDGAGNFQGIVTSGGNTRTVATSMTGRTDMFYFTLTNNSTQAELFINAASKDTDATALAAWTASDLVDARCVLGAADNTPANEWSRDLAYPGIYDEVVTQSNQRNQYNAGN
jgi:hypothetical protein